MIRYVLAIFYGFATILITAFLFALGLSMLIFVTDVSDAFRVNSIYIATYTITFAGGFILGVKAKNRIFFTASILCGLFILFQFVFISASPSLEIPMQQYLVFTFQALSIFIGAIIGGVFRRKKP